MDLLSPFEDGLLRLRKNNDSVRLPRDSFSLGREKGGYLAFLGRTSPEKGLDDAINPVELGCDLERHFSSFRDLDVEYFETVIKPLLDPPIAQGLLAAHLRPAR
jgi:hypothetical protein